MKKFLICILNYYQKNISPFFRNRGVNCKYYPTCSEYTKQAIKKYGVFKGILIGTKRITRCNPFSKGGYDPLK